MPSPSSRSTLRLGAAAAALAALASFSIPDDVAVVVVVPPAIPGRGSVPRHLAAEVDDDETFERVHPDLMGTVHTFYEPIDPETRGPLRGRRDSNVTTWDRDTVDAWREAWEARGWKTKVLTLRDAQRHPDYDRFAAELGGVPLGGNAYYNRLCYLRWLAMAAKGGGWMSDVDVVPIAPPPSSKEDMQALGGGGRFTSYGGFVPSLMRGSASEWDRMARLILGTATGRGRTATATANATAAGRYGRVGGGPSKRAPSPLYSDMMAMMDVRDPAGSNFAMREEVLQTVGDVVRLAGGPALEGRGYTAAECARLAEFRAVHFSHVAVAEMLGVDPWKVGGGVRTNRA